MAQLILLGTGAAWSGPARENTYMLLRGAAINILIDVAGSPAQRLAQIGLGPHEIDSILLTHNHPDHIYGLPIFILNAWMAGRRKPLDIYGLPETLRAAQMMLKAIDTRAWPDFFKIKYHTLMVNPRAILALAEFEIEAMQSKHFVPTIALRLTNRATGKCVAYSADTSPDEHIVQIARGADVLLHEATQLDESKEGHSSALEAGQAAAAADVKRLILIHVPPEVREQKWRRAAKQHFRGRVSVARDFDVIEF